jgi:hypothetical protein
MNSPLNILSRRDAVRLTLAATAAAAVAPAQGPRRTDIITVSCSGLEFQFDPTIGFVRHIKWNGIEVLNGLYVAVRDEVWGTVPPQISNVIVETEADAFKINFEVSCKQGGIDFLWNGKIQGAPRALDFEMEGEAKTTFKRNRIGFCVLHPLKECAGKPCKVDHGPGSSEEGKFPDRIAPHQPFINMTGIRHEVYPGLHAELRFTGDTFEMEDHRNWTDGNFKSYCTPLSLPFPVEIKQGTKVIQSVQLRLAGTPKPLPPAWKKPTEVVVQPAVGAIAARMPSIGFGIAMDGAGLTAREAALLRLVNPAHLRVDLRPVDLDKVLNRAAADLKLLPGVGLEAAVFVTNNNAELELAAVAEGVASRKLRVARWMVFHVDEPSTSKKWVEMARRHLKGAPVGGGTNMYFTELNRGRPEMAAMDFASYSINPQVHAFDDMSLMENLAPQAETLRTARTFIAAPKQIAVSPVTLRPRFNPQAKVQPETRPGELPSRVDPRQATLFGAAWTTGSLQHLAAAASVTYYETHGWAGLMERESGSALPELFRSTKSGVFPLFHVFASIAGYTMVLPMVSSDSSAIAVLGLRKPGAVDGGGTRLVIANLTADVQRVKLAGAISGSAAAGPWKARILDTETLDEAVRKPEAFQSGWDWELRGSRRELSLLPYATAILTA